jgi:hypothetical protein
MPQRSQFYFFLNGDLHRRLRVNRGKDLLVAWNYPEHKKVTLNYTDVQRRKKKAFTTKEAAGFVNRSWISLAKALGNGDVPQPQYSYSLETGRKKEYWWSEEDILGLLDYYASLYKGRPRKDGNNIAWNLPTPRELRALINDEDVLYVKRGDSFVPTWRAQD